MHDIPGGELQIFRKPPRMAAPREQPVAPFSLAALSGPHCPKIIMGDDRALICGYLARLYDLYCCEARTLSAQRLVGERGQAPNFQKNVAHRRGANY
jgi:hypothetical protein